MKDITSLIYTYGELVNDVYKFDLRIELDTFHSSLYTVSDTPPHKLSVFLNDNLIWSGDLEKDMSFSDILKKIEDR